MDPWLLPLHCCCWHCCCYCWPPSLSSFFVKFDSQVTQLAIPPCSHLKRFVFVNVQLSDRGWQSVCSWNTVVQVVRVTLKVRLKSFVGGLPPDILDTNRQFSLHPQYNCLLILIFSVKLAPWRACNNLTLPKVNVTFDLFSLDADSFNPVFSLVLLSLLTLELIISPVFWIELSPESACLLVYFTFPRGPGQLDIYQNCSPDSGFLELMPSEATGFLYCMYLI